MSKKNLKPLRALKLQPKKRPKNSPRPKSPTKSRRLKSTPPKLKQLRLQPVEVLQHTPPYLPPVNTPPGTLPLHASERPLTNPDLLTTLHELNQDLETVANRLGHYPDPRELCTLLQAYGELDPAEHALYLTAGADESLDRLCRTFLGPNRSVILTTPTFEMIPYYAKLTGAKIYEVPWCLGAYPLQEVLKLARKLPGGAPELLIIVSPNNPTGLTISKEAVYELATTLKETVIAIDMAYGEYALPQPLQFRKNLSPKPLKNLVTIHSLSKAWGLAGLRLGYTIGTPEIINWLRAAGGPYSVSSLALHVASKRLTPGEQLDRTRHELKEHVARVVYERQDLQTYLENFSTKERPLCIPPSAANFVCIYVSAAVEFIAAALASLQIRVRTFKPATHLSPNLTSKVSHQITGQITSKISRNSLAPMLRLTCPGGAAAYEQLKRALKTVFAPEVLLLSLEGVIAGVQPTSAPLTTPKILAELAKNYPLGLLSTWSHQDTLTWLTRYQLQSYFQTILTREELNSNSPTFNLELCLHNLGGRLEPPHAWLLSNHPELLEAAKDLHLLPLSVQAAHTATKTTAEPALINAKVAKVLYNLKELRSLLP